MPKKKQSSKNKTQTVKRDPIPWRYCILTLCCGLILAVGFFLAARSHFSSIDYGIKNSKLRKQIEELEADKRRLILSKEIALSPAEIKKAAKKIGLTEMTASNIEVYRPPAKEKSKTEKLIVEKPKLEFLDRAEPAKKEEKKPEVKTEKKSPDTRERIEKTKMQIAKK
jgi:hypothetical protein